MSKSSGEKLRPGYRACRKRQRIKWKLKNRDKDKAHRAVMRALRSGKLFKHPCIFCLSVNTEAHHRDYSKPLEVIWLCGKHHRLVHRLISQV